MSTDAVLRTLAALWGLLEREGVPAALAGGLALASWKHPRTTRDVDILIGVDLAKSAALQKALSNEGFIAAGKAPVDFENTQLFQYHFDVAESLVNVKVDFLVAQSDFAKQALRRAQLLDSAAIGFRIRVMSCEDLILFKLLAGRIIDLADAAELLRANAPTIDVQQLAQAAAELELTEQLNALKKEAAQ